MAARPPAVARVLERVTGTVRRHALIEPGNRVLLAVSGGADSLCLLHSLHLLRRLLRVRLAVVHVDHGLRPEGAADARYVARAADRLGVPCAVYRVERRPPRGASPEAWLRTQRHRLFGHALRDTESDVLATGHTADDQAETVLAAVIRGGGLESVSGMPPRTETGPPSAPVIRPLLEVTREETRAFCRAIRLRPRRDSMNEDRRYLRAAVRHEAIPALERATGRRVVPALVRTADSLRADADYLRSLAADAAGEVLDRRGDERLLAAVRLRELPPPVAARVVLGALREMGSSQAPTHAHVETVLDLARGRPGRRADLAGGLIAVRDRSYVRLSPPSPRTSPRTSSRSSDRRRP